MGGCVAPVVRGTRLRAMEVRDLDEVAVIERASFRRPWTRALFENELRIPFSRAVVAQDAIAGGVVGYLVRWWVAGDVHLLDLAVAPARRRRGVGRVLLEDLLAEARAGGARRIELEVARRNEAARGLYGSMGFAEVGRRLGYYGDDDALLMEWRACSHPLAAADPAHSHDTRP